MSRFFYEMFSLSWGTNLVGIHHNIAAYNGNILRVTAGPGTGKTFALMRRAARLVEQGADPSKILAVTFTRTGAKDLVRQLSELDTPKADQIEAITLHSLSFSILSKNGVFQTTNRHPRPLLKFEVGALVSDLATLFGGKTVVKDMMAEFETAWATLEHQHPGWPIELNRQEFQRRLRSWLIFHEAILLGEPVPLALEFIQKNPVSPLAPSFEHVLADEYQDLNRADQELIDALATSSSLSVVGDEDQSIYTQLRHARPEGIVRFGDTHPGTHDEALNKSRRCPSRVVSMANSLILRNHPERPATIVPNPGNPGGDIHLVQFDSLDEEVASTAAFIDRYLRINADASPVDVLVLPTRRLIGYRIRDELTSIGRPDQSFFTEQALDKVEAQEGLCILTLLARPGDRTSLRAWLAIGSSTARSKSYGRLSVAADKQAISSRDYLDKVLAGDAKAPPYYGPLLKRYSQLLVRLKDAKAHTAAPLIDSLWPPGQESEGIRALALSIVETEPDPDGLLSELIRAITQPDLPGQERGVIRIMSLQKSKGLTARCVVINGCVTGALPLIKGSWDADRRRQALEEQRRLFYVAMTRTSETLVISSSVSATLNDAASMQVTISSYRGANVILQSSPYLSELGSEAPKVVAGRAWKTALGF
jgi:DNA helicase-2/ATP-dependent DNA helicase PcrA